ncbi:Modulator of FtsH protease HflC [Anaerobiospirillum thomasii]|uniref:Protein HflC n=1 Tax=Anaerobiospirillum thomasii TaxID=179995 RepID=A0A2X0VMC0_9GAMM|nr:protease modulator HflC [Anaerobiospirillum thomasii]SPT68880.1 Modulator of FtsH protease HflC [Anaerobiospirillum thomasii]SPT71119.1 Modulator of FtsH protease HflC [Anaerobiospirillum thomasii]
MRSSTLNLIFASALIAGVIGFNSLFVIKEGNVGIVTRFGKVIRTSDSALNVSQPGLHFKIPFIDQVRMLDSRIQTLSSRADRFVTAEKKDLIIDSYVKWKISDPATYYLTTAGGNKMQAEELLRRRITNSLRSQIGKLTIHEIVSGQGNEDNTFDASEPSVIGSSKRDEVMQNALKDIGSSATELGIQIVDVRIKQINLPPEVSNSIYQRMRAERDAVAKLHRSQGRQEAEAIRAKADREVVVKVAQAERKARMLKGEGDAQATKIYADAYSQNPELFDFLRSMDAYRNSMKSGNDVMVINPDNEFFRYFDDPIGRR